MWTSRNATGPRPSSESSKGAGWNYRTNRDSLRLRDGALACILYRRALQRGDFKSKENLAGKLVKFIEEHNRKAKPLAWTNKERPITIG